MVPNSVNGKSEKFSTKMDPNDLQCYNPPAKAAGIVQFDFYGSMKFLYTRLNNGHKTFWNVAVKGFKTLFRVSCMLMTVQTDHTIFQHIYRKMKRGGYELS